MAPPSLTATCDEEKKQEVMETSSSSSLSLSSNSKCNGSSATASTTTTTTPTTTTAPVTGVVGIAARLARPNILELQPYRCARDDYSQGILLDANENAYGPTSLPAAAKQDNYLSLERYPDPYQHALKEAFCAFRNRGINNSNNTTTTTTDPAAAAAAAVSRKITPANVFCGVGSDEAIDLLMRIFCVPGSQDNILITPPTYGMYKVCAKVNDVKVISVPLTPNFEVRIPEILDAVTPHTKLLFLCSPGNPTARAIPLADIVAIASSPRFQGLVVVDEAYVDFCCDTLGSAVSLIAAATQTSSHPNNYNNIVVLQTLSKAFGLAGIRCGFCVGAPDVIQFMNNVKAPYNTSSLTSEVALRALSPDHGLPVLHHHVSCLRQQRQYVMEQLQSLAFVQHVFPSDANFILFRLDDHAYEVYKLMAEEGGVVTRYRGHELHCTNCIRVTIGTLTENSTFVQRLKETYQRVAAAAAATVSP